MRKHHYEVAREAFSVIEFYRDQYKGNPQFQEKLKEVVESLRKKAKTYTGRDYHSQKFLLALVDALVHENQPGEYKSPFK